MFEAVKLPEEKAAFYQLLQQQAEALMTGEDDCLANLANIASLLFLSLEKVNWAGFYITRGEQLVLGPFQGKPACVRIPFGSGVCGSAAARKCTQLVKDVDAFPGHIACDAESRSEIVVPVVVDDQVVAVLDIDSPVTNRFDEQDQQGLETLVKWLEQALSFRQIQYV